MASVPQGFKSSQRLPYGDVTIVAPDGPRSGFSGAITTTQPLRLKHRHTTGSLEVYSCEGTPVDCVKLALNTIFADTRPDLVLSGINHGSNEGICVSYSGTLGAAREGCIYGIPSLAASRLHRLHRLYKEGRRANAADEATSSDHALAKCPQGQAQGTENLSYDSWTLRRRVCKWSRW